jgi:hypothetical protein
MSAEREYLVRHRAARAEWARLWRLVLEFPLAETMTVMRHFRGGWRPADEDGRRLFALLAGTSPEAVSPVVAEAVMHVRGGRKRIRWVSFAPLEKLRRCCGSQMRENGNKNHGNAEDPARNPGKAQLASSYARSSDWPGEAPSGRCRRGPVR